MKKIIAVSILFVFLMSACAPQLSKSSEAAFDYAAGEPGMEYADEEYVSANTGTSITDATLSQDVERVVIKNASIGIIVDDPAEIMAAVGRMAEESGGFIVNSQLYKTQTDQGLEIPGADITIRVPADLLTATLDEIKSLLADPEQDIRYENVTGQDVTREYTDLKSRLTNLEQAKVKLEEIMDEAYQTEDVLSVYNQLTSVSEQIEVLKGQIQYFNEASRLSSIAVEIVAHESIKELVIGGWQPAGVARKAIQALIDTLEFLADAAIWIALYILPVGLCLFIPAFLIYLGFRWLLRRRKHKKLTEEKNNLENLIIGEEKGGSQELE